MQSNDGGSAQNSKKRSISLSREEQEPKRFNQVLKKSCSATMRFANEGTSGSYQVRVRSHHFRYLPDVNKIIDWAYICYPDSRLYLAPYPDLIQQIRASLQKIWDSGMRLENNWATAEMRKQTSSLPLAADSQTEAKPKTRRADSRARSPRPNQRGM